MLPTSSDPMAPGRVPRHPAGDPGGTPADNARGRHRRPESLADTLAPAPAPVLPSPVSPSAYPASPAATDSSSGARHGWSGLVPAPRSRHAADDATSSGTPSWADHLAPDAADWSGGSWTAELGSTGAWQSGDILPDPAPAPRWDPPEPETTRPEAGSRNAWAFESTGEWLLSARRPRDRSTEDTPADVHPADAAIAAARSAAAQLRHERAQDEPGEAPTRHGSRAARAAAGGAHRAPEPPRPPAWARITGSLPLLSRRQADGPHVQPVRRQSGAPAQADDRPAPRRKRAGRRRAAPAGSAADPAPATPTPSTAKHAAGQPEAPRGTQATRRRSAARSGRHARSADPFAITVRPTAAILREDRDAQHDWTWTGDSPSPTGSHRAPGTLPLEAWLHSGRGRPQALLAAIVAAGLALVMIPVQWAADDVDPVTASGEQAVVAAPEKRAGSKPNAEEPRSGRRGTTDQAAGTPGGQKAKPDDPAKDPAPAAQPPASADTPRTPAMALPPGDGPARSLRYTGTQAVALTFDDGPDPVQTPKILAMLADHGVKATFCLVGEQALQHPDVVRQIVAAGHTLCNHSWNHSFTLGKKHPNAIRADLARTNEAIRAAVPDAKIPFFRAPGGNFTDRLVEVAYADGMASLYWQVDPRDWERAEKTDSPTHVKKIVDDVRKTVRPGSIVLSHDFNQPDTITAYAELLPWLRDNFELGVPTVPPPVTPDAGGSAPPPGP